ncbi:MAG: copper chaperone PCu(A)C [Notoacmeibacter sp.]|nr:copper chaperone PCu(A)C [Notoacmeibacter sp.]MCC0032218.1 copper chaperone PCu(A)C [Brucellaceae bacterium]
MKFPFARMAVAIVLTLSTAIAAPLLMPAEAGATDMAMVKAGDLEISGYWARAMLPAQPAAGGFLTVTNTGKDDDRLVAVETPRAGRSEIHEMAVIDNVMKMRQLADGLAVPAGSTVELKPGGYHLMFLQVAERFEEGQAVPVVLTFEKAGKVELTLPVKTLEQGRMMMDHGSMDHSKMDQGNKPKQ